MIDETFLTTEEVLEYLQVNLRTVYRLIKAGKIPAVRVGRQWRSVKYDEVYLRGYGTVTELTLGLAEYFAFYNGERPHQSLDNRTPNTVYADGQGGGASIPDHVGVVTGQRCSAAIGTMGLA